MLPGGSPVNDVSVMQKIEKKIEYYLCIRQTVRFQKMNVRGFNAARQ